MMRWSKINKKLIVKKKDDYIEYVCIVWQPPLYYLFIINTLDLVSSDGKKVVSFFGGLWKGLM